LAVVKTELFGGGDHPDPVGQSQGFSSVLLGVVRVCTCFF
jgi:hypothetical protein